MAELGTISIEDLPVGAAICNKKGIVKYCNARLRDVLDPQIDGLDVALDALLGPDWLVRLPIKLETGTGRHLTFSAAQMPDGWLLTVEDRSDAELIEAARDLVAKRLSHDLRSPLAAIIGLARSVAEGVLPPDREGYERIAQQAETALARADTMLGILRATALKRERFEAVDLIRVVHEAGDLCWGIARRRGVALSVEDPSGGEGECLVWGELELLRRGAQQCIDLALQHADSGAIVLRLSDAGSEWQIDAQRVNAAPTALPTDAELLFLRIVSNKHGGRLTIDLDGRYPLLRLPKLTD